MASSILATKEYDPQQVELMKERIIIVDEHDRVLRSGSKEECHVNSGNDQIILHRAFSAFIFDSATKKLLLQKRASEKITFPSLWANTCCSHPLYVEAEMEERDHVGVKRAAIRKLNHELGIPESQLPIDKFHFLGTIHYLAPGSGGWGEHEIDHCLALEAKWQVDLNPNPNEVSQARWVDEEELRDLVENSREQISPWFHKIQQTLLPGWWEAVRTGQLTSLTDYTIKQL